MGINSTFFAVRKVRGPLFLIKQKYAGGTIRAQKLQKIDHLKRLRQLLLQNLSIIAKSFNIIPPARLPLRDPFSCFGLQHYIFFLVAPNFLLYARISFSYVADILAERAGYNCTTKREKKRKLWRPIKCKNDLIRGGIDCSFQAV
jgi:hypothetical protein